ncbi:MAG TPA: MBL fold metallo-hydrolase [Bacillota bacterium]|nr:MBL fold metallo-hydrolase [Bacillota bacterium]
MEIRTYPLGPLQANMYAIIMGKDCFIIDPCVPIDTLGLESYQIRAIFCTHGHFDHVTEADRMVEYTGSPLLISRKDEALLRDAGKNGSGDFMRCMDVKTPVCYMEENDFYTAADFQMATDEDFSIRVISTPGHTPGSVSILFSFSSPSTQEYLFTGDTLFAGSIGRTDLGGSDSDMRHSLALLADLDERIICYPGHGASTTIRKEKMENPYFTATFYNDMI